MNLGPRMIEVPSYRLHSEPSRCGIGSRVIVRMWDVWMPGKVDIVIDFMDRFGDKQERVAFHVDKEADSTAKTFSRTAR